MTRIYQSTIVTISLLLLGVVVFFPTQAQDTTTSPTDVQFTGTFGNGTDLNNLTTTVIYEGGLNENWGEDPPVDELGNTIAGINADNFSARFQGTAFFIEGAYTFTLTADDGANLYLNDRLVIEALGETGLNTNSTTVSLSNGSFDIRVDYVELTGSAVVQLTWANESTTGTVNPTTTPVPAVTAQVRQVSGLSVRTGPFLGASFIGVARPDGNGFWEQGRYPVLARNNQEGVFTWYKLQYDDDTVGWSSGRYLEITGNQEVLPYENTIFDTVNRTPNWDIIGTTRSVMNFRVYPSQRVGLVQDVFQIPWGAQVEILARTRQNFQDYWYLVDYRGHTGWIFAAFVDVEIRNIPIDAIPIW